MEMLLTPAAVPLALDQPLVAAFDVLPVSSGAAVASLTPRDVVFALLARESLPRLGESVACEALLPPGGNDSRTADRAVPLDTTTALSLRSGVGIHSDRGAPDVLDGAWVGDSGRSALASDFLSALVVPFTSVVV
jgi:hypothetical protein